MARILVLLSHSDYAHSHANRHWRAAAETVDGLQFVHLESEYPDGKVNVDAEVARLQAAERIVLQFPMNWYATPPLLKHWQDTVLTEMFYIHDDKGAVIDGRPLMVAVSCGNKPSAYTPEGRNLFSVPELLKPLHSTAHRCSLEWTEPFITYENNHASEEKLQADANAYKERLEAFGAV